MKERLKEWVARDGAADRLMAFVNRCRPPGSGRAALDVLDVGCGYGRYMTQLLREGHRVTGVELNPDAVAANRAAGRHCLAFDEWRRGDSLHDVIFMAHIIEHFAPQELLDFVDSYLDRLRPGGHLVVATPLLSPYFYDDFDHVKPYHVTGFLMVFGNRQAQVQYSSRNKLELEDVWFRRSPYRFTHVRGYHLRPGIVSKICALGDLLAALAFRASFRLLGRTDGWVGLFRRL